MPLTDAQKLLNARLSYGGAEISMKVINGRHLQEVVRVPAPAAFVFPRVEPAARDELRVLATELARGAKWVKGSYWATGHKARSHYYLPAPAPTRHMLGPASCKW